MWELSVGILIVLVVGFVIGYKTREEIFRNMKNRR